MAVAVAVAVTNRTVQGHDPLGVKWGFLLVSSLPAESSEQQGMVLRWKTSAFFSVSLQRLWSRTIYFHTELASFFTLIMTSC